MQVVVKYLKKHKYFDWYLSVQKNSFYWAKLYFLSIESKVKGFCKFSLFIKTKQQNCKEYKNIL